jgi:glycosyltransferase involved in cell wall biosynthesis
MMRIVIDVRHLPCPATVAAPAADHGLELVLSFLRSAADCDIHLWLAAANPESLRQMQRAWEGILPYHRLHPFTVELIPTVASPWFRAARAALECSAIAALRPDLVWIPGSAGQPTVEPAPSLDAVHRWVTVPPPARYAGGQPALEQLTPLGFRYLQSLKNASAIWVEDAASAHRLSEAVLLPDDRVRCFDGSTPAERARELEAAVAALEAGALGAGNERLSVSGSRPCDQRPTVAYLSPLPPARSGISDYSAELLPELIPWFDITLVNVGPPVSAPWLSANLPVIDLPAFRACAHRFDHVIYQTGNSEYHAHMVALLAEFPGVVVLHDFFLGHLHAWRQFSAGEEGALVEALYEGHGWLGLQTLAQEGVEEAIRRYPVNSGVLAGATGIIVHSRHATDLARLWLGAEWAAEVHLIPHLRRPVVPPPDRQRARQELGLDPQAFVVCSFGFLGPTKCNRELLEAWQSSALVQRPDCHLVFVGKNADSDYGEAVLRSIRQQRVGNPVRITGFADPADYRRWLAAADVAVQLRQHTRGESSGTVLDCLAHGVPLVVNAHGGMAELPTDCVWMLPDDFAPPDLRAALEGLHADPARRDAMAREAPRHIARAHHPVGIGDAYRQALEHIGRTSPLASHRRLINRLGSLPSRPTRGELDAFAEAVAVQAPVRRSSWYLDITTLRTATHVTGIERVTQALLMALLADPEISARVVPVYADPAAGGYREARSYLLSTLELPPVLDDPLIFPRAGDLFFGLDWVPAGTVHMRECLNAWRSRGVRLWFMIHDILPVTHPEWFPGHVPPLFQAWLDTLAHLADGCVCVSAATAAELGRWWEGAGRKERQVPDRLPRLAVSHNGADIPGKGPAEGDTPALADLAEPLQRALVAPFLLMVGTIEPRKGYGQVLGAMAHLWSEGEDLNLVIVGRDGWRNDSERDRAPVLDLVQRLRTHPWFGKRLFWLQDADDQVLSFCYSRAVALLAASENEGFGLPLVEAALHGTPLIVRDIPVFREVVGDQAWFFRVPANEDAEGRVLARNLHAWMVAWRKGEVPVPPSLARPTWKASAARLRDILKEG